MTKINKDILVLYFKIIIIFNGGLSIKMTCGFMQQEVNEWKW